MTDDFTPRLDILPKPQRRLWDELTVIPVEFVLYGGTTVALHVGHRQSVDFDFFGNRPFDPATLTAAIPFMAAATITQREPNTLSGTLSFFDDGNLRRLPKATKDRLAKAAREVDLDRLPVIARPAQSHDRNGGPSR